ncbi:hypothetical protein [Desulfovibrio ferrophilus]|uniref:Putative terminase small subunit n=1 Tax=Desulfovibrio ferrophilus TaxID=241368 RepID=A0A2Z6AZS8_9BACT|nr:hypothetical protein [Desulfovibrio ferrophilus]BBD08759.1 putative terminase small subunit [Desulfovibrio ferrophilus]
MSANIETKQHKIKGLIVANPEQWLSVGAAGASEQGKNIFAPRVENAPEPMNRGEIPAREPDEQWVVQRLVEVVERCMQSAQAPASSGQAAGEWKFDTAGAIRGLTLLGKNLGMFSERVEHQVNVHEDALDELA